MKIKIAWIGKTKEPAVQALTNEFIKRISRYAEVEGISVRDEAALLALAGRPAPGKKRSAGRNSTLIIMDSRGKPFSSEEFAEFLRDQQESKRQPLLFAVGGADGFSDQARASAEFSLSLGRITIAHELARLVLMEQIYRAFTILKGHPYHSGH